MRVVAIIEARMSSTRLPGKVLLEAAGKPMLAHLIYRLKNVEGIDKIVIATTTNAKDDVLEDFAKAEGVGCFRGSEADVLERVLGASNAFEADLIVEITGDCPIIDPELIQQAVDVFFGNSADYVSNNNIRSYPDGMDVQVFKPETLYDSSLRTQDALHREHVTLHIRQSENLYSRINLVAPKSLHWPELGLTLDERSDYELLKLIIEHFAPNTLFSCSQIIEFLKQNPSLVAINANVERKGDA